MSTSKKFAVKNGLDSAGDVLLANAMYVNSKTSGGTAVRMLGINGSDVAYVGPIDSGPSATIINASSTSAGLYLYTSGTEKMRIDTAGNVGIGGTPTAGAKLDLRGVLYQNAVSANTATNQHAINVNGTNFAIFYDVGLSTTSGGLAIGGSTAITAVPTTPTMFWNVNTASVGIGTSAPAQKFHILGSGSVNPLVQSSGSTSGQVGWNVKNDVASTATFSIYNSTQAAFGAVGSGEAFLYSSAAHLTICTDVSTASIKFATGTSNAERMRIDSSGNVGVGTSAPGAKFGVSDGSTTLFKVTPASSVTTLASRNFADSGYTSLIVNATQTIFQIAGAEAGRVDVNGNFGFGTAGSAGEKLHVMVGANDASIRLQNTAASTKVWNLTAGGGGNYVAGAFAIRNVTDSTTPFFITGGGAVGINQTSPATNAKLDINGTVAQNITAMAAVNFDLSAGSYFTKTVSGATTFTVSNIPASRYVSWQLKLTNGGSAAVTWPTGTKWAGGTAPTLTASGIDIISFFTDDGGTTMHAFIVSKDSK